MFVGTGPASRTSFVGLDLGFVADRGGGRPLIEDATANVPFAISVAHFEGR